MQSAERIATLTLSDGRKLAVVKERQPSRSYGRRFVILFEDAIDTLSDKIRSGPTLRVMLKLAKRLDFETWRRVDQRQLGEEL